MFRRVREHRVLGRIFRFRPIAVVAALALVVFTAGTTGERPGTVIRGDIGVQKVRLSMPATDTPRGVAIFFHGQTGGVDNRMDEPWLQSLVRDGWIVASSDFHTHSWGNADSTEDTLQLAKWATKETGQPVRLYVSGSMGATVALNAMTHGAKAPDCFYGVKPAVDLTKMQHVPGARKILAGAYPGGIPNDRNPVNTVGELPAGTQYRMVSSYEDTWVVREQNTDKLVEGLKADGAAVSVFTVHGTHDDPSHFNAHDLVDFADSCAG